MKLVVSYPSSLIFVSWSTRFFVVVLWWCLATTIVHGFTVDAAAVVTEPVVNQAWCLYKRLLITKPLVTKSATAAVLSGISDAITQRVVEQGRRRRRKRLPPPATTSTSRQDNVSFSVPDAEAALIEDANQKDRLESFDWTRSTHIMLTGYIWSGPAAHYWYQFLEEIVQLTGLANPLAKLLTRSVLDALIFSPVTIAGYFTVRTLLETCATPGGRWDRTLVVPAVATKLQKAWFPVLKGAWRFWPLVNGISFWFLSVQYRVLYANVVALLWTGFLSFMNPKQQPQREATAPPSATQDRF